MKRMISTWPCRLGLFLGLLGAGRVVEAQDCMRWGQRQDVGNPGPQSRHCMTYDRDAGVTLLFSADAAADLWQYDGTSWAAKETNTRNRLTSVRGLSQMDVWVGGAGGSMLHTLPQ